MKKAPTVFTRSLAALFLGAGIVSAAAWAAQPQPPAAPAQAQPASKPVNTLCPIMETDVDRISWDHELFTHVPEIKDGYLIMPDRPGWGTEPVESALAAYPPRDKVGMQYRTAPPKVTI